MNGNLTGGFGGKGVGGIGGWVTKGGWLFDIWGVVDIIPLESQKCFSKSQM